MSAGDVLLVFCFAAFLYGLIFVQRRRPIVKRRTERTMIAEAVARATVDPPPVAVDRPSRKDAR